MPTLTELLNNLPSLESPEQMARQSVPHNLIDELAEILDLRLYDLAPLAHPSVFYRPNFSFSLANSGSAFSALSK
ncbi:MAG: hypothetical protein R2864_07010 [Syntrophotaleaceae bacterium]